jgi:hypothetical protein
MKQSILTSFSFLDNNLYSNKDKKNKATYIKTEKWVKAARIKKIAVIIFLSLSQNRTPAKINIIAIAFRDIETTQIKFGNENRPTK